MFFISENLILADSTEYNRLYQMTQLFLTVILDDIDPNDISLGDENCKPTWSNETHAQFITHIDNCSLVKNSIFFFREKKIFGVENWI